MSILYQNVHSIRGCLNLVRAGVNNTIPNYDISILTETWLNDEINDAELGLDNYNVIRCDRFRFSSEKVGVSVIAINKKNLCNTIIVVDNTFELTFLKVITCDSYVVLGDCYIPPNMTSEY